MRNMEHGPLTVAFERDELSEYSVKYGVRMLAPSFLRCVINTVSQVVLASDYET